MHGRMLHESLYQSRPDSQFLTALNSPHFATNLEVAVSCLISLMNTSA